MGHPEISYFFKKIDSRGFEQLKLSPGFFSFFLIYFDETLRTANSRFILLYLHFFLLNYYLPGFFREILKFNVSLKKNDNIIYAG